MKQVVRIEQPKIEAVAPPQGGVEVSVARRGIAVAFYSFLPVGAAIVGGLVLSASQSDAATTLLDVLASRLDVFSLMIPVWLLTVMLVFAFSACFAYFSIDYFFVRPVRMLHAWVKLAHDQKLEHVERLNDFGNDEFADIVRMVSESFEIVSTMRTDNQQLLQEKSIFITIAAHQLRTPLTGLLWTIESLLDPSTPQESRQQLMVDVENLLKRMRLIVNHILASANVEAGKFGYVFEKVDIVPIIAKLVDEFKPVAEAHQVALQFVHPDAGVFVSVDSERISLAIFDLLSNAIDYTPAGGMVTVSATPHDNKYEIAISDTGIGISETELPHLFGKFYRSERARHIRPDGSGLGLYLVKEIITSHGSTITVTSKEGSGSRFSFSLDSQKA